MNKDNGMTHEEFAAAVKRLCGQFADQGLVCANMNMLLGCARTRIYNWKNDKEPIPVYTQYTIENLDQLNASEAVHFVTRYLRGEQELSKRDFRNAVLQWCEEFADLGTKKSKVHLLLGCQQSQVSQWMNPGQPLHKPSKIARRNVELLLAMPKRKLKALVKARLAG